MGLPFLVLLMLALRTLAWAVLVSLSASSASAISREEKGPSRVAALGFLMGRCFPLPTKGAVLGKVAALLAAKGLMGVAGASCGGAATAGFEEGATVVRFFPMLRMAGSMNADCCAGGGSTGRCIERCGICCCTGGPAFGGACATRLAGYCEYGGGLGRGAGC
jgi:hypothetical protein